MATPQVIALKDALDNIEAIQRKLVASGLTQIIFSTPGPIPDSYLDSTRGGICFEFQLFVQNIRAIKKGDAIVKAYPDIHYRLKDQVARRNWLIREDGATPIEWYEFANSIYGDVPKIQSAITAALKGEGVPGV